MKLAVSNIAWPSEMTPAAAALLVEEGVTGVEIAPTAVWPDPLKATTEDVTAVRRFWAERGVQVIGFQSLLFGHPEMTVFGDGESAAATQAHLGGLIELCARLGGEVLVFGSPKNRLRGTMAMSDAVEHAANFFRPVAKRAEEAGVALCIEPNPPGYGCDFVTRTDEGTDLVHAVGSRGFCLHLDSGGMTMAAEPTAEAIRAALPVSRHFHISEPNLQPVGSGVTRHQEFGAALSAGKYRHWVSIEMRASPEAPLDALRTAVRHAQRHYASLK